MGWSSAFVLVPTDNDLQRALEVVKAHNEHDGSDVGEVLVRLDVVEVPRKKVCRRDLGTGDTVRILVFASQGGMWGYDSEGVKTSTWNFFSKRGFGLHRYNDKFKPGSELRKQIEKEMRRIDDIDLELVLLNSVLT
jgi:hypothetical protein